MIATEMNGSKRIDRQLVGRAARQGDPGSFQYFLSFEDELLMQYNPVLCAKWKGQRSANSLGELPARWFRNFCHVQKKIERRDCKQRIRLFKQTRERMRHHQDVGFDLYLEVADGT